MRTLEYDGVIIGGGVIGCAIARELSRYDKRICLIEAEEDVCSGTSKANSAIIHGGFDAACGSKKARFNVEGNARMEALSEELDFEFRRNGSLVLCFSREDLPALETLYRRGLENGVPGLRMLSGEEVREMEPHVTEQVTAALFAPTGGIVCPFGFTIALAENACENGVDFLFETRVEDIEKKDQGFRLTCRLGLGARLELGGVSKKEACPEKREYLTEEACCIHTSVVINAAGVYADKLHNLVSEKKLHITPRRGEYCLLDKEAGNHVSHTIFQLPGKLGKGVLVTPTVHGNLLVGPTAVNVEDKEDTATTAEGLQFVAEKAALSVKDVPMKKVITSFAGLRAHEDGDDFVIGEVSDAPGFFDVAGIESPGLSAAPAIGAYVARLAAEKLAAGQKADWNGKRKGILRPQSLSIQERTQLIRQHPEYGIIVCRCEGVSEGEIRDAIRRRLGAVSLDGIKRRVRQGMGRCQAGFCSLRTMEILAEELGIPVEAVQKNGSGSNMIAGNEQGGTGL